MNRKGIFRNYIHGALSMDTLFIFSFVFGIFGWCIWQLLQFTRDTIGENSPLKVKRIYTSTTFRYFVTIENFVIYYMTILAGMFFKLLFTMEVHVSHHMAWLVYLLIFVIFASLLFMVILYLSLLVNHWKYTENVVIETRPETHQVEVNLQGRIIRLSEENIERIQIVHTNSKLNFGYLTYYLVGGDFFILSSRMDGFWVIQEFFKKTSVKYEMKRFPYIS